MGAWDRTLVRAPGCLSRGFGSRPAPRLVPPLPAPPRSPRASKASSALPWLPHFLSLPPLQLSVWLWFSCRRLSVPWMPRSSPCWPLCWPRSASATVSVIGGQAGRLGAPGSGRGSAAVARTARSEASAHRCAPKSQPIPQGARPRARCRVPRSVKALRLCTPQTGSGSGTAEQPPDLVQAAERGPPG